jgi:hypothetical protein
MSLTPPNGRPDALARMQLVMGDLPDSSRRVALDVQVVAEGRDGALIRRKLTFATEPGDRAWAWLLMPPSRAERLPAMLCLHQTAQIGKDEPVGLGGKPNLQYARELAQRGFVTLSPDYPNFGEYKVDCYAMGYASATMKGIWNHIRALDLLTGLPEVDADRLGCIGHSLGAHNALFLAAFDPRVQVTVASCGFTRFTWNDNEGRGTMGDLTDWSHAGYMPRIAGRYGCRAENMPFDFDDVLDRIVPRAMFINAPTEDFFRHEGVRECLDRLRPAYARRGVPHLLGWQHPACDHDFPPDTRRAAFGFVERVLSHAPAAG